MHTAKSLKSKKIILYIHTTKKTFLKKYICFSMHLGFNNQFIKVTRTRPIFQKKTPKKIYIFSLLISGITNLYIKRTPNIKKLVFYLMLARLGFTP
jgi:hypothetical protein